MKYTVQIALSRWILILFTCFSGALFGQKTELRQLELNLEQAKTENEKTIAYLALGNHLNLTDFESAFAFVNELEKKTASFSEINRVEITLLCLNTLEKQRNYKKYFELVKDFYDYDYSKLPPKLRSQVQAHLGFVYTLHKKPSQSKKMTKAALADAITAKDYSQATYVLNLFAYEALINKEKAKSLEYTRRAIKYAKRSESKLDLANCFNTQATLYRFYGENETSIRKNLLAFEMVSQEKALHEASQFSYEIGQLQEEVKNYQGAKYYYEISLKNAKKLNDRSQIGQAMTSIANILRLQKKYSESQKMNKAALKVVESGMNQIELGDIEKNLGLNCTDLNLTAEALIHYKNAIAHYKKVQNKGRIAAIYYLMGGVYNKVNNFELALEYLLKSNDLAENFHSKHEKYEAYPLIAEVYSKLNKKDLSIKYLTEYIEFTDREHAENTNQKIAEIGEAFRSEENDRKLAEQSKILAQQESIRQLTESKLENATLRSRFQNYFIVGILVVISLATVIGIYRSTQANAQRKRKQAEMSQTLLRTQMNPHFIFNAMSVIQSYIYDNDVEKSSQFLVSFSRLIRLIMENSPKENISIATEIEILNKYLETQKLRFEKRFDYEIICEDNLIFEKTLIPPMITQPFVENSIEHGELHLCEQGKIIIRFSKNNNMLQVEIEDNGVGIENSKKNRADDHHTSLATSITEERIRILNEKEKSNGFISIRDLNEGNSTGTLVVISLPFKKELSSNKIPS